MRKPRTGCVISCGILLAVFAAFIVLLAANPGNFFDQLPPCNHYKAGPHGEKPGYCR